jgi:hypothetical protein
MNMKNLHVPLPVDLDAALRAEAARQRQPATTLARAAIEEWLRRQEKVALHRAISSYAAEWAGTDADLDEGLEQAGLEHLAEEDR